MTTTWEKIFKKFQFFFCPKILHPIFLKIGDGDMVFGGWSEKFLFWKWGGSGGGGSGGPLR